MTQSSVPRPSVLLTAFACPHCGAHANQTWFEVYLKQRPQAYPVPIVATRENVLELRKKLVDVMATGGAAEKAEALAQTAVADASVAASGEPKVGKVMLGHLARPPALLNVFVSECFSCAKPTIWLHDRVLFPGSLEGPTPNPDLSPDVTHDFEEARSIVNLSPRGAAALLRLAVEKICIELGAQGEDINQRIAYLVKGGLPDAVQEALDALRVIGNEAVHPGTLDLRDDRDTALMLFDLVNFIADEMITRPKARKAVYNMIPPSKREGIVRRNARAKEQS